MRTVFSSRAENAGGSGHWTEQGGRKDRLDDLRTGAVKIQYQWVSTDNPNDVTPPANDYIRTGRAYTAKAQQNSHQGYTFDGWYTDTTCTVPYVNGTVLNTDTVLYGRWKAEHGNLSVAKTVAGNNGDSIIHDPRPASPPPLRNLTIPIYS